MFTLVGIAGEDDLDAPDLMGAAGAQPAADSTRQEASAQASGQNGASSPARPVDKRGRREQGTKPTLPPDAARKVRDQLMGELKSLGDPDALAAWAHRVLPLKNQLSKEDAQRVEEAFADRLQKIADPEPIALRSEETIGQRGEGAEPGTDLVTTIAKPVRERDRNHLRFVATQPCCLRADTIRRPSPETCRTAGDGTLADVARRPIRKRWRDAR